MKSKNIEFINEINTAGQIEKFLPTMKIIELDEIQTYKVNKIKKNRNTFGNRIILQSNKFQYFLPMRYSKISDDAFLKINKL